MSKFVIKFRGYNPRGIANFSNEFTEFSSETGELMKFETETQAELVAEEIMEYYRQPLVVITEQEHIKHVKRCKEIYG